jgi:hypothetical protein
VAPALTISGPTSAGEYSTGSTKVSLSGRASDNVGVTQVTWNNSRGGSGTAALSGSATSANWTASSVALQSGSNTVTVTARDAAGHTKSASMVVTSTAVASGSGSGKTYYVDASAANDSGDGSSGQPKKYIASGAALLSGAGGDTLIVRAGTYGNARDAIGDEGSGKSGAWNVIKAEVDGAVTITAPLLMGLGDHYVQFEGLKWDSKTTKSVNGRYVKILRCAFKDGPAKDNTVNLAIGTNDATPGAQYVLVEDSYVYGAGGRYNVLVYNADKVVLRRMVARHQDGWSDTKGDPQGVVALYNSTNVLTQNLLLVDSGASGYFEAALYHPSNSHPSSNIHNEGAIILNIAGTGVGWDDHSASTGNLLEDSVIWKTNTAVSINGAAHSGLMNRLTIGQTGSGLNDWSGGGRFSLTNSLLWEVANNKFSSLPHSNNVCYSPTCSGEKSMNPASSGLLWLTQTGVGSALSTAGAGSGRVGATVLKRLGTSGTLWGEAGYDATTTQNLWPWPDEARIKKSMCTDVGVSTGFCAKPSITQYVWGFLGNTPPASFVAQ